ncbi:hypothetical protein A2U01_0086487, partial [Trifolium medium]|nr:hypothetical protein [Trifolium medium]
MDRVGKIVAVAEIAVVRKVFEL